MYLLFPDGQHPCRHGGDCPGAGRRAGGAAGRREPKRSPGLAAVRHGRHAPDLPAGGEAGDEAASVRLPTGHHRFPRVGGPVYGKELQNAAYVLLRGSEDKNEEVYDQMDLYTTCGHRAAVSLRSGSVGYAFWQEEFLRQVRDFLSGQEK